MYEVVAFSVAAVVETLTPKQIKNHRSSITFCVCGYVCVTWVGGHSTNLPFIFQMYQTCIGHTEGAVVPVYVLLSDSALYLLTTKYGQKKFKKEGRVKYRELDYVSVSNADV